VQTKESYIYTLVLLFLFAIVVEVARLFLSNPSLNKRFGSSSLCGNIVKSLAKSLVFFLVISGCYLLMLAVMTYSTGVFIVVCAGSAIGYMIGKALEGREAVVQDNGYSLHSIKG